MIIHCDSCGKAVSNRLEHCPFCSCHIVLNYEEEVHYRHSLEELIPSFRRKTLAS